MAQNENDDAQRIPVSQDGTVTLATGEPLVSEQEIAADVQHITILLDGMYWELAKAMEPFQKEWDADAVNAMKNAVSEGALSGCGAWADSIADLFEAETWSKLGSWIGEAAGTATDTIAGYAKEQYKEIEELLEKPGQTVFSMSWWFKQATDQIKKDVDAVQHVASAVGNAVDDGKEAIEMATKIWKHREAIANLPNLISIGDVPGIENFVDTVVKDIDPKLHKEIRDDPEFHAALALIEDSDSILTYMTYLTLALEAIPPNFLAYLGGKVGMFIVCEIVLTVILALLTAGAGVLARVTSLLARIAASSAKVAGATKKIERAIVAFKAFEMMIRRLFDVAKHLRALGHKLNKARQRPVRKKSPTRGTMVAKKETVKRDPKCAICGSTHHHTPANYERGTVVYE